MDIHQLDRRAEKDGKYAIAAGLFAIARAIDRLGNADAATPMGGMEALGDVLSTAINNLANSLEKP